MTQDQKPKVDTLKPTDTWMIFKNVIIIGLAFMLQFTAYNGAANLQSSINAEASLGTASLAAVYAGQIFSNVLLPAVVIRRLGTKWTISISFITFMPYIAAHFYPTFYTLIPAALIVGLGAGPLWCSKCTYLSAMSEARSKISKISAGALLVRYLGLFFMIFQMNQVWGNLISSLVLTSGNNTAATTSVNETMIPMLCGSNFLPSADAGEALPPQPPAKIQMLSGIYLACMAGAVILVAIGVDSMKRCDSDRQGPGGGLSSTALLTVTLKLMAEPTQMLLIVITLFVGLQQAFFSADFTAAFVSCAIGTGSVGFVMMTLGVANALGSVVTGYVAKLTGRLPLLCSAAIGHAALFVALLNWRVHAGDTYILHSLAALWGVVDSVWMVQLNAFYGVLFRGREEAAFSNYRLWKSLGYIIAYIVSPYLRTSHKTYMLLVALVVGMMGYLIIEYQQQQKKIEEARRKDFDQIGCDNIAFQTVL